MYLSSLEKRIGSFLHFSLFPLSLLSLISFPSLRLSLPPSLPDSRALAGALSLSSVSAPYSFLICICDFSSPVSSYLVLAELEQRLSPLPLPLASGKQPPSSQLLFPIYKWGQGPLLPARFRSRRYLRQCGLGQPPSHRTSYDRGCVLIPAVDFTCSSPACAFFCCCMF
jgi:hypothetical protein